MIHRSRFGVKDNRLFTEAASVLFCFMAKAKSPVAKYLSELGRKGGEARMKWTAEQRRASALKASQAAAKARALKAKKSKA
jgi:hypothetical protein